MRPLTQLALASGALSAAVLVSAACAKVRIDARAHLATGESREAHGLSTASADELELAGIAYTRAIASWSPLDPAPRIGAASVERTAEQLVGLGDRRAAIRLLEHGVAAADASALLLEPLAMERQRLVALRGALSESLPSAPPPEAAVSSPGGPPESAAEARSSPAPGPAPAAEASPTAPPSAEAIGSQAP